ncbi:MAG: peptidylprolyl isomerase [Sphaerochaeta sp.]
MPSDKQKNVKDISPKKKKKSVGWIFGMVILILIAVSFVAAPAIEAIVGGSSSNELVFGSYDGEDITYSQDSYFYDQYQLYGSQYQSDANTDSNMALYQIWSQAFNSTVIYTAITQMAEKVGFITTEDTLNQAIIDSGYYNDEDGNFDIEAYNKTSVDQKASIRKTITRQLPYQTVLNDVGSIITSSKEAKYVGDMADATRSFKYVTFDQSTYPKELTAQYAITNAQLFNTIDLSIISTADEEEANAALASINEGTSFEDVATDSSKDSYASTGGELGSIPYYAIKTNFKNVDESMDILNAKAGDVLGPYETENGWAIYRVNTAAQIADYTSEDTLTMVRNYIANYDSDIMDAYLNDEATKFAATVTDDFDAAATAANLTVNDVTSTSENIGNSQYMSTFSTSDTVGTLATAAADDDTMKLLFDTEVGTTVEPIKSGSTYIVAYVQSEDNDSGMGSYIESVYPYYAGTHNQQDLESAIMSSDKLENNFLSVFIDKIMSNTSAN